MATVKHSESVRVRRFEPGASCEVGAMLFLRDRGYHIVSGKNPRTYVVKKQDAPGRPKTMSLRKLIDILDAERMKLKLEPVIKR